MATAALVRPLLPVDETRVFAVAWEMWERGDWLVPFLGGEPYSHKPPLLQWLILGCWSLFGVGEWPARLIAPAFLPALALTARGIARELWPAEPAAADRALLMTGSCLLVVVMGQLTLYEIMLAQGVLLVHLGMLGWRNGNRAGLALALLGFAIGGLTKGPVVLLHTLLPWLFLLALPATRTRLASWKLLAGLLGTAAAGAVLTYAWALPAALSGGETYAQELLWGQTSGRLVEAFQHQRPWWYYLPLLAPALLPWGLWPSSWGSAAEWWRGRRGFAAQFLGIWFLSVLIALSLISSKQVYYLLASLPAVLLILAWPSGREDPPRALPRRIGAMAIAALGGALVALGALNLGPRAQYLLVPGTHTIVAGIACLGGAAWLTWWRARDRNQGVAALGTVSVLVCMALLLAGTGSLARSYHVEAAARFAAQTLREGKTLAWVGSYHGQLHFAGRFTEPFVQMDDKAMALWATHNPEAVILNVVDRPGRGKANPFAGWVADLADNGVVDSNPSLQWIAPYRGGYLVAVSGAVYAAAAEAEARDNGHSD
jgi:4-amino-4-deoxy-L-arabinose transferase-like glycosyltransferase